MTKEQIVARIAEIRKELNYYRDPIHSYPGDEKISSFFEEQSRLTKEYSALF